MQYLLQGQNKVFWCSGWLGVDMWLLKVGFTPRLTWRVAMACILEAHSTWKACKWGNKPKPNLGDLYSLIVYNLFEIIATSIRKIWNANLIWVSFALYLFCFLLVGEGDSRHFGPMCLFFLNWCREHLQASCCLGFFSFLFFLWLAMNSRKPISLPARLAVNPCYF